MKQKIYFIHPVIVFIVAQLAWLSLVGMWIYLYVFNWIVLKKVGSGISVEIFTDKINLLVLISGFVLLLLILGGMYVIFIFLVKQVDTTKLYDNFIASVTHELKSPLASIQLYLETLKARDIPQDKRQEFIDLMLKDTKRLKNLIDEILELSRIEQRRPGFHFTVEDGADTIRNMIEDLTRGKKIYHGNLKITSDSSGSIVIDRELFAIVVRNLLDNAFKYSSSDSQVNVHMYCKKNGFVVEFTDRGMGIPVSEQKNIFKKFYRLRNPDIPDVTGSGLGLYIVREIVRHHRSRISIISDGKGRGSTFRINFPLYIGINKKLLKPLLNKEKTV